MIVAYTPCRSCDPGQSHCRAPECLLKTLRRSSGRLEYYIVAMLRGEVVVEPPSVGSMNTWPCFLFRLENHDHTRLDHDKSCDIFYSFLTSAREFDEIVDPIEAEAI